jgi:branched-chain amino acid aminotransferase
MENIVYLNGLFMPLSEAKISVTDSGFLFGYGIFETMRSYSGKIFRLDDHLSRLSKSADRLAIPVKVEDFKKVVLETVSRNEIPDARVRLTITLGEGNPATDPGTSRNPTVLVTLVKYTPYPAEIYGKGFKTIISTIRRNSRSPLPGMKTACFLESLLARQQAREAGVDDALLLNDRGNLAEASSSNLFLVANSALKTPGLESGILPGITRGVILKLAAELRIKLVETDISPEELMSAEESFITNSMIEIMPLTTIDGQVIGSGKPGPVAGRLMTAYRGRVFREAR